MRDFYFPAASRSGLVGACLPTCARVSNVLFVFVSLEQSGEKSKKAPKVKAPDINDEEFPGLPGMAAKPKSDDAEGEDGEDGNADGAGSDGDDKTEKVTRLLLRYVTRLLLLVPLPLLLLLLPCIYSGIPCCVCIYLEIP